MRWDSGGLSIRLPPAGGWRGRPSSGTMGSRRGSPTMSCVTSSGARGRVLSKAGSEQILSNSAWCERARGNGPSTARSYRTGDTASISISGSRRLRTWCNCGVWLWKWGRQRRHRPPGWMYRRARSDFCPSVTSDGPRRGTGTRRRVRDMPRFSKLTQPVSSTGIRASGRRNPDHDARSRREAVSPRWYVSPCGDSITTGGSGKAGRPGSQWRRQTLSLCSYEHTTNGGPTIPKSRGLEAATPLVSRPGLAFAGIAKKIAEILLWRVGHDTMKSSIWSRFLEEGPCRVSIHALSGALGYLRALFSSTPLLREDKTWVVSRERFAQ
jgi:hypothetical protein